MDCDTTTNWDDAHNPFVFYEILCTAISNWSLVSHTAGPKNPMHADHINPVITDVFDMSLSMSLRSKDIGGLRRDKRWGLSGSTVMYSHPFDTFWMMRFRNYFYAFENNLYRPHLKKSLSRSFSLNFFL